MTSNEAKLLISGEKSKHFRCPGCGGVILYEVCPVWKEDGEYVVVAHCGGPDSWKKKHNCGWEEVFEENSEGQRSLGYP